MKSSNTWVRLMPRVWWAAAMLLPVTGTIISGCGGGGGGLSPSGTPIPGPSFVGALRLSTRQTATLSLSTQGRIAQGTLKVDAPTSGLAQVLAPASGAGVAGAGVAGAGVAGAGRKKSKIVPGEQPLSLQAMQAIAFTIPAGTYRVGGSFTPPQGFSVTGEFPVPIGPFALSGQLPISPPNSGSFTLLVNGQSTSGTFALPAATPTPGGTANGTPNATATATSIATPGATPNGTRQSTPVAGGV